MYYKFYVPMEPLRSHMIFFIVSDYLLAVVVWSSFT